MSTSMMTWKGPYCTYQLWRRRSRGCERAQGADACLVNTLTLVPSDSNPQRMPNHSHIAKAQSARTSDDTYTRIVIDLASKDGSLGTVLRGGGGCW